MKKGKKHKIKVSTSSAAEEPVMPKGTARPQLSQAQINRIERSKEQISNGQFLTNEEMNALADQWLKE